MQVPCPFCGALYLNLKAMRRHKASCVYCDKCQKYVDIRHLKVCKGKTVKGETLFCLACRKFRSKNNFSRHMFAMHAVKGWKEGDHPDIVSKVIMLMYN